MGTKMISNWMQAGLAPFQVNLPYFRYKQTSVAPINDATYALDAQGYLITANNFQNVRGDAMQAYYTANTANGPLFVVRAKLATGGNNVSMNIYFNNQVAGSMTFFSSTTVFFNGQSYTVAAATTPNTRDFEMTINMVTDEVTLSMSTAVGGPKVLLGKRPATNAIGANRNVYYYFAGQNCTMSQIEMSNTQLSPF